MDRTEEIDKKNLNLSALLFTRSEEATGVDATVGAASGCAASDKNRRPSHGILQR